jgi:hypothetical protein
LSKTLAFEALQSARNTIVDKMLSDVIMADTKQDVQPDVVEDSMSALEMEDAAANKDGSPSKPKGKTGSQESVLLRRLLETVEVKFPNSDWSVEVLTDVGVRTVFMKLTEENMQKLYAIVASDLSKGVKRTRFGSGKERPPPQGAAGSRKYAVGRMWVTKVKHQDPESGRVVYRQLKKLRSDEAKASEELRAQKKRQPRRLRPRAATSGARLHPRARVLSRGTIPLTSSIDLYVAVRASSFDTRNVHRRSELRKSVGARSTQSLHTYAYVCTNSGGPLHLHSLHVTT